MKNILLGKQIITGKGALAFLAATKYKNAFIVTGGSSMIKSGVIDKCRDYLKQAGCQAFVFSGIGKNPTIYEVMEGVAEMRKVKPDVVIAVGGGSAMDAAKGMLLFYEFPALTFENVLEKNKAGEIPAERKTGLICVSSTSGTGSEVTRGTVITDPERKLKVPIMTDCLRPDYAVLDAEIVMSVPFDVAAQTGMDALTHAMEAYTNHNLDDFDEALCIGAIKGIMKWLLPSCLSPTLENREKVHNYQAMAGIAFANVGLGAVHGIAHSFGAVYNLAHGLTNAVILPYILEFNKRDEAVKEKLEALSESCGCEDIVQEVCTLRDKLKIPHSFQEAGISEEEFTRDYELLTDHAMLGATNVNPVKIDKAMMYQLINMVYYGQKSN